MKDKIYFGEKKHCYKGALHFHTQHSDGRLEAREVVKRYKELDYHFISWSDHDIYGKTTEFDSDNFITIPGMERGGLNPTLEENDNPGFHFGCIEDPTVEVEHRYEHLQEFVVPQKWEGDHSVSECISDMENHGNLVILNHPEWHMTEFNTILKYDYFAIEIYNYATEWTTATSYGTAYLDHALQNGKRVFAVASDDAHDFDETQKIRDYGGAWIMVNADQLSHKDIIENMKVGNYYSSSGPEINHMEVKDGILYIQCSPCKHVMFKAWPERGDFLLDRKNGSSITEASLRIGKDMEYIRVECIDMEGNVAWSNPIFVNDLRK